MLRRCLKSLNVKGAEEETARNIFFRLNINFIRIDLNWILMGIGNGHGTGTGTGTYKDVELNQAQHPKENNW